MNGLFKKYSVQDLIDAFRVRSIYVGRQKGNGGQVQAYKLSMLKIQDELNRRLKDIL